MAPWYRSRGAVRAGPTRVRRARLRDPLNRLDDRRGRDAELLEDQLAGSGSAVAVDADRDAAVADVLAPAERDAGLDRDPAVLRGRQHGLAVRLRLRRE